MRDLAGKRTARLAAAALALAAVLAPAPALAATATKTMYRLYNPNSGEHFYTASAKERDGVVAAGWRYEGVGWTAPVKSNSPVYRLYSGTDHHYTTSAAERDHLVSVGWKYEGVGWYSDDARGVPLYRQFNPNVDPSAPRNNSGSHNYTTSKAENDHLVSLGWRAEGVGWYGVGSGSGQSRPADPTRPAAADPGPFADDAGEWTVWGTCEWRVQGGTLYVRPTNAWNGEGTLGAPKTETRTTSKGEAYQVPVSAWKGSYKTVKSSGKIHLNADSQCLFADCASLTDISALASWDASGASNLASVFSGCKGLASLHGLDTWNTGRATTLSGAFSGCYSLRDISALAGWNTSNVQDLNGLFADGSPMTDPDNAYPGPCFTNVNALRGWDVSKVTDMSTMLHGCEQLQDVSGLAGWKTSSLYYAAEICSGCKAMKNASTLNGWDVSHMGHMGAAFIGAGSCPSWYPYTEM